MSIAITLREVGGPEKLLVEQRPVGRPGSKEVRIRQTFIGVNFHDVYVRNGLYKTLALPGVPGIEAVGIVEEIGPQVEHLNIGDRVGYVSSAYGGYAGERLIFAEDVILLPSDIDDRIVAASLVKGLTAQMLLEKVHHLERGEICLVHAAAGGVGRILCQWAASRGAFVIGTVGSKIKAELALKSGCTEVIECRKKDVSSRVRELTRGHGADVIYDSVGKETFAGSLESLSTRGHLVAFGQSSGPIEPFMISRLAEKSNTISRPILFHFIANARERAEMASAVFDALRSRVITADIGAEYSLRDVAEAHRALESRLTTGSTIMVP